MAETMELYMSKTRADYGSGVARPKIEDKDNFELQGPFRRNYVTNTFSGQIYEDANEHIEKVLGVSSDLFTIPNITIVQVMLRAFPVSLTRAASRWGETNHGFNYNWDEPIEILSKHGDAIKELLMKGPQVCINGDAGRLILFYKDLDFPTRLILDSLWSRSTDIHLNRVAAISHVSWREFYESEGITADPGFYHRNNVKLRTRMKESMEDTLRKFMSESAKRHEENSNLIKEIRASTDAAIRNQGASIKTLEIQIGKMSKNHTLMYETRQMMIPFRSRLNEYYYEEKKGSYGPQFLEAHIEASHMNNSIPRKEKDLGSFTLPCFINNVCFDNTLVDLGSSVSVMPLSTYLNLGLGELAHTKLTVELADMTMKYPKGIAKNVLVGIGKFVFSIDFIILDMPEDIKVPLILGRLFVSIVHAKIDVYKRKITLRIGEERIIFKSVKPASSLIKRVYMLSLRERIELDLEARLMGETLRNQGDDLMPTIKEGKVIEEFRTRDDELDTRIDDYPSYCDYDKKIHIDCAHNLKFSCMIGFEFTHANFFPLLYVNVMSKKFHNSIMKDKMVYKGNNVIGALMNVPIFVGTFSVVTDFVVLEDMDAYRDEGMGDVFDYIIVHTIYYIVHTNHCYIDILLSIKE
ncbi:reverse transcriptase domain-containing protein [Tanacetum coccineum]